MQFDLASRNNPSTFKNPAWGWTVLLPLLILLPASASSVDNKGQAGNKASTCIAKLCLATPLSQKEIVAQYGEGRKRVSGGATDESVSRCYYDPKQDLYVEFNFDKHVQDQVVYNSDLTQVMVSRVPMCEKSFKPKHPFPKFVTELGLTIGSTEAEVQAAMGKPNRVGAAEDRSKRSTPTSHDELMRGYDAPDYGETSLFYSPDQQHDLLANFFYISQGKVKSILLSVSE